MGPKSDKEEEEKKSDNKMGEEGPRPPAFALGNPNKIRKYLLLLQDSLAIKFVPLVSPSHPFPLAFNPPPGVNGGRGAGATLTPQFRTALETATTEVDHSLHALYLYKSFRESNLHCYWNGALTETFGHLQYKGYVVPSTLLVSALPHFLSILRTAWARQMLRSPPGYRIEFLGEIEELIAEPIAQGQFAPLSDSICWAIFELTSIGEEAFVDSILNILKSSFPLMTHPGREVVYQTLETLIRERKIYQTARGYFVVTPDTFRFMTSTEPMSQPPFQSVFTENAATTLDALFTNHSHISKRIQSHLYEKEKERNFGCEQSLELELDNPRGEDRRLNDHPGTGSPLKRHNSLKTFRQRDIVASESKFEEGFKDSFSQRSSSMRLSKSKSCGRVDEDECEQVEMKGSKGTRRSTLSQITAKMIKNLKLQPSEGTSPSNSTKLAVDKGQKGKSLFKKMFSRSKSRESKTKSSPNSAVSSPEVTRSSRHRTMATSFTQTSNSTEELTPSIPQRTNSPLNNFANPPREFAKTPKIGERPSSRRSTESPVYDVLHDPEVSQGQGSSHFNPYPPVAPNFPAFHHHREDLSRCSTLSQATSSLGYGSQGYPSLNSGSYNCNSAGHSPCPYDLTPHHVVEGQGQGQPVERNESIRKPRSEMPENDFYNDESQKNRGSTKAEEKPGSSGTYDFYRRRYPSYSGSFSRASPHYASLNTGKNPGSGNNSKFSQYEPLLTTTEETTGQRPSSSKGESSSTTTVTQNMKSTTNMELELVLPLGNIMKAALNAKKQQLKDEFFRKEYNREPPSSQGQRSHPPSNDKIPLDLENLGGKLKVGEPRSNTEIRTTVDKDGVLETQFESLPGVDLSNLRSKVEIKLNDGGSVQVTKSTSKLNPNPTSKNNKGKKNHLRRDE